MFSRKPGFSLLMMILSENENFFKKYNVPSEKGDIGDLSQLLTKTY